MPYILGTTGMRRANATVSPPPRNPPLYVRTYVATMSQQSWGKNYTRFWAVSALARDEVYHWVWGMLNVPHLARPSQLCPERSRPCWRRLSATGLFSYVCRNIQPFIGTYRYISITIYVYKQHCRVAGKSLWVQSCGQCFECRMALFFSVPIWLHVCWRHVFVTSV